MRYRVLCFVMRADDDERAQKARERYLHLNDMREREKKTFLCQSVASPQKRMSNDKSNSSGTSSSSEDSLAKEMT